MKNLETVFVLKNSKEKDKKMCVCVCMYKIVKGKIEAELTFKD